MMMMMMILKCRKKKFRIGRERTIMTNLTESEKKRLMSSAQKKRYKENKNVISGTLIKSVIFTIIYLSLQFFIQKKPLTAFTNILGLIVLSATYGWAFWRMYKFNTPLISGATVSGGKPVCVLHSFSDKSHAPSFIFDMVHTNWILSILVGLWPYFWILYLWLPALAVYNVINMFR
mmetsp:Transcript_8022/g.11940  ORF Transcript_8022/g.11940 Transcript_8022/m.11940 type:complete len:176 (+) Transcript_8022:201-728(+)